MLSEEAATFCDILRDEEPGVLRDEEVAVLGEEAARPIREESVIALLPKESVVAHAAL